MKKNAIVIVLFGLLLLAVMVSLPGPGGSMDVSAYPAPNALTPTGTRGSYEVFLPNMEKCMSYGSKNGPYKHGVGVSGGGNPDDAGFLGASWWYGWHAVEKYMCDPSYVPMWQTTEVGGGWLPADYSGYILMFNEPGALGGTDCLMQDDAVDLYLEAKTNYPNAKLVIGNFYSWDSLPTSGPTDRTSCTDTMDNTWRKHFLIELAGRGGQTPPQYWGLHGYVYENIPDVNTSAKVIAQWEAQMGSTLQATMVSWWNEASPGTLYDITSYSPTYWITEYGSRHPDIMATPTPGGTPVTPTPNGYDETVSMMDWVDEQMNASPQTYKLERAAVFNNRCDNTGWCNGFQPTNLMNYNGGDWLIQEITIRGEYFLGLVTGSSLMSEPPEEEELQYLDPYPFAEQ